MIIENLSANKVKYGLYSKLRQLNPKMGFGEPNKALRNRGLKTKSGLRKLIWSKSYFLERKKGENGIRARA